MPITAILTPATVFKKYGAKGFAVPAGVATMFAEIHGKFASARAFAIFFKPKLNSVIAHHHRVVPDGVHGQHHRIVTRCAFLHALLIDRFQRGSLDSIAAIDQQAVRIIGAGSLDQRCDFRQTTRGRLRGVVIVRQEVSMQVRSCEQRDLQLRARD